MGNMPGLVGRKRKDPALKLAEGDRNHRGNKPDYSRDLVQTPMGVPEMPERFEGRIHEEVWNEIVPLLAESPDLISLVDGPLLEDFVEIRAQKLEIEAGMFERADAAEEAADPREKKAARAAVIAEYQKSLDGLRARENMIRRELALTPAARSSLKVGPIKTSKTIKAGDALEEAFFGGSMRPV